jgi:DNA-binding transcriptional ArsR family regulator
MCQLLDLSNMMLAFVTDMDLSHPLPALFGSSEASVLTVLASSGTGRTGREIARLPGVAPSTANGALSALRREGVVHAQAVGNAIVYELADEHLATAPIRALVGIRTTLFERLRAAVTGWTIAPVAVLVFGSVTRGESDARSDIDLLVVRRDGVDAADEVWREQVASLERVASALTGNDGRVLELAESSVTPGMPVLVGALEDGVELADGSIRALRRLVEAPR